MTVSARRQADPSFSRSLASATALHIVFLYLVATKTHLGPTAPPRELPFDIGPETNPTSQPPATTPRSVPTTPIEAAKRMRRVHGTRSAATASDGSTMPTPEVVAPAPGSGGSAADGDSDQVLRGAPPSDWRSPSRATLEASESPAPPVSHVNVRSALEGHSARSDGLDTQTERLRGRGGLSRAFAFNLESETVPVVPGNTRFGGDKKGALRGTLCFIAPGTQALKRLDRCVASAVLYADSLDIPWRRFTYGFPGVSKRYEWFALDYRGTFQVRASGAYQFRLFSQDGSILWIDGDKIIDNDGMHIEVCGVPCAISKMKALDLSRGRHSIRVMYFRGPGRIPIGGDIVPMDPALQLFVTPPGQREILWGPVL